MKSSDEDYKTYGTMMYWCGVLTGVIGMFLFLWLLGTLLGL